MNIEKFIKEVILILNNDLYEKNLITYNQYQKAINEVRRKKICM